MAAEGDGTGEARLDVGATAADAALLLGGGARSVVVERDDEIVGRVTARSLVENVLTPGLDPRRTPVVDATIESAAPTETRGARNVQRWPRRPVLVFVSSERSGPSRKMESLVAWYRVTRKRFLDVRVLDAERDRKLVERLGVSTVPSLVLLSEGEIVGRLEGRATGRQISDLIAPHVPAPERRPRKEPEEHAGARADRLHRRAT